MNPPEALVITRLCRDLVEERGRRERADAHCRDLFIQLDSLHRRRIEELKLAERVEAERDRLIDSYITPGGPFQADRFVAFRDMGMEDGFDTMGEARAYVRQYLLEE